MLTNHELADFFDGFAEALPEFAPKLYAGGLNPADLTLYREIMAALYGVLAEYTGDDPAGIGPQPSTAAFNADLANMVASMMEATSQDSLPAMLRRAAKDLRRGKMQESGDNLLGLLRGLYALSGEIAKPKRASKKLPRAKPAAPAPAPTPAPAAPATGQRRTGWLDPALGRIEILVGQGGRRGQAWSNIQNGGTRFGWNGTRWARNLLPSQKLMNAVLAEGWGPEFGRRKGGSVVPTGSASAPAPVTSAQPLSQTVMKPRVSHTSEASAAQTTDDRGNPLKVWVEESKSRGTRLVTQRKWKGSWAKPKASTYDEFGALALGGSAVYYVSARTPETINIMPVGRSVRSGESYKEGTSWSGATGTKTPGYDDAAALLGWTPAATAQWAARTIAQEASYSAAKQARDAKEAAEAAASAAGSWVPDPLPTLREIKGLTVGKGGYGYSGTKIYVQGTKPEEVATVSKTKGRPARWSVSAGIKERGFITSSHNTPYQSGLESPEDVLRILEAYRQTGTFSGSLAQSIPGIFVSNPARRSNPLRALKS